VFPEDSILADYVKYAREQVEGADAYILGSILPVCSALLGRRVYIQWGDTRKYPNLFCMLAGKAGDRKSSSIKLAEALAYECLPPEAFLPQSFSPETLFDEYDEVNGGCPDKLWIVDDANATLKDWQKTRNGERVATRFLQLYDCGRLSESFRRNKQGENGKPRRFIEETSTSLVFGATFNICAFQGQAIRAGLARRFLYYLADAHGRLITRPQRFKRLDQIAHLFRWLIGFNMEIDFSPEAGKLWNILQLDKRKRIQTADSLNETLLSRLNSAPMQTLSIAIIFEACRVAHGQCELGALSKTSLELAIIHVEECLAAADALESIANRATLESEAEIVFARVRRDFASRMQNGSITLSKTDLTSRYCRHGWRDKLRPEVLYHKLIPVLIRQNRVRLLCKEGKREMYAFRADN
jgi:hypothetical protein